MGQGRPPEFVEDLPAGAVRVTTTTPDGTTVQYYPPSGELEDEQAVARPRPRQQARPRQAAAGAQRARPPAAAQQQVEVSTQSRADIAMPKPVQIPQTQDPRSGWDAGLGRAR